VPIHLDHSRQFEQCMEAATCDFNHLCLISRPFEENIVSLKQSLVAAALGISSEGGGKLRVEQKTISLWKGCDDHNCY
jgi:fructose-bisphosphate aldolase class II